MFDFLHLGVAVPVSPFLILTSVRGPVAPLSRATGNPPRPQGLSWTSADPPISADSGLLGRGLLSHPQAVVYPTVAECNILSPNFVGVAEGGEKNLFMEKSVSGGLQVVALGVTFLPHFRHSRPDADLLLKTHRCPATSRPARRGIPEWITDIMRRQS
ncbi:hypothetical protein VTI74DRAFT_1255 [Chaetomium olivicolor]